MRHGRHNSQKTTIANLVMAVGKRVRPTVREDATIKEVMNALVRCPRCRVVYVVDPRGRLAGTISAGMLTRHVFSECFEPSVVPSCFMFIASATTAGEIMSKDTICAREDEDVDTVIRRMVGGNLKEMPVVDGNGGVVADITVVDLLEYGAGQASS